MTNVSSVWVCKICGFRHDQVNPIPKIDLFSISQVFPDWRFVKGIVYFFFPSKILEKRVVLNGDLFCLIGFDNSSVQSSISWWENKQNEKQLTKEEEKFFKK